MTPNFEHAFYHAAYHAASDSDRHHERLAAITQHHKSPAHGITAAITPITHRCYHARRGLLEDPARAAAPKTPHERTPQT